MKLITLVLAQLLITDIYAQTMLFADDPGIRYDMIESAHTFAKVSFYDSSGKKTLEFVNENVILRDSATNRLSFCRFRQVPLGRMSFDTSLIGSQPLHYHFMSSPLTYEVNAEFSPSGAHVQSLVKGVRKNEFFPLKKGYFDDNIVQDISGYLPLLKGTQYTLFSFRFESVVSKGVNTYQIEYIADDYLNGGAGIEIPCRILSYQTPAEKGWLWVSQQTRELLKMVSKIGNSTVVLEKI
jgi:hypothetical protein